MTGSRPCAIAACACGSCACCQSCSQAAMSSGPWKCTSSMWVSCALCPYRAKYAWSDAVVVGGAWNASESILRSQTGRCKAVAPLAGYSLQCSGLPGIFTDPAAVRARLRECGDALVVAELEIVAAELLAQTLLFQTLLRKAPFLHQTLLLRGQGLHGFQQVLGHVAECRLKQVIQRLHCRAFLIAFSHKPSPDDLYAGLELPTSGTLSLRS